MKKIMFIITVLSSIQSTSYAQQKGKTINIDAEFNLLLHYKREYEKYSEAINKTTIFQDRYTTKRDSMYSLYTDQIENIRKSPEKYLTHIIRSIKNNKVEYDGAPRVLYNYVNLVLPYDADIHTVDRLELYRIIKKYIFEQNDKLLPQRTEAYIKAGGIGKMPMPLNM